MGSGNYLHRGSWEPSVVSENPLEKSGDPPTPVSLGPGWERGMARGPQHLGVTGQVLPAAGESLPQTRTRIVSPMQDRGNLYPRLKFIRFIFKSAIYQL